MYASTSARRASASIRRAPSRTSSSITDDAADRAAPEPSRSAESETTVSIGSYLPDQRLPRRSSLEPSIGHPGRYAPYQADPQISSIAQRFDVLVHLLIHRWGLVGIGDDFDVGGAVGLLGCL